MIMILSLKDGQMAISMEFAATDENQVTAEEVLCDAALEQLFRVVASPIEIA